jgi:hypothetical protein
MSETKKYKCRVCSNIVNKTTNEEIPVCCGKKMILQLPNCRSSGPEMENIKSLDEPCDDGRNDLG